MENKVNLMIPTGEISTCTEIRRMAAKIINLTFQEQEDCQEETRRYTVTIY